LFHSCGKRVLKEKNILNEWKLDALIK